MTTLNSGISYEDYLEHYGVKGMRWGRRKGGSSGSDSSVTPAKKAKKVKAVKPDVKKMSDKELRDKINRMQMEQQYAKLTGTKEGRSKIEIGKEVFKRTMTVVNTANQVYSAYNSPVGKLIRDQINNRG